MRHHLHVQDHLGVGLLVTRSERRGEKRGTVVGGGGGGVRALLWLLLRGVIRN